MPEQVRAEINKTKAAIMDKLGNGAEPTTRDIVRLLLVMIDEMMTLADVHANCGARAWYATWSRWANIAVGGAIMALIVWIVNMAIAGGFRIPTP